MKQIDFKTLGKIFVKMNFTIEQKEEITRLLSSISWGIGRAYRISEITPVSQITKDVYIKDVTNALEHSRSKLDELKQYLMEIDER